MLDANAGLLNARGGNGESAAMLAVYYGKKSVLELLLGRGAELNIFEAAAAGKVERVVALLAADPSPTDTPRMASRCLVSPLSSATGK